MQPNELPLSYPFVSGVYLLDIELLAKGDKSEYDFLSGHAKECVDFFSKSGNDNRVLGQIKCRLVNFGLNISLKLPYEWGKQNGLYVPPMLYVNDFAKANPEIQRTIPIVSLGEEDKPFVNRSGDRGVLVLRGGGGWRELSTRRWGGDWGGNDWFLFCEQPLGLLDT